MWFDDEESRRHHHGYGNFIIRACSPQQSHSCNQILIFRNTRTSLEFHSSKHQPRMRPTLNRPSWQWLRKLRIALGHHRVPQIRKAKLKSKQEDVQLKANRVDAVKSPQLCRVYPHYYDYNAPTSNKYFFLSQDRFHFNQNFVLRIIVKKN